MEIIKSAVAGSMESCDIQILLRPNPQHGIAVELKSDVEAQFGDAIRKTICDTLTEYNVKDVQVQAVDRGAIDCVIRARMQCALFRAAQVQYDWSRKDKK